MNYDYVSVNYYFALRVRMGGIDVYDKETDKFLLTLTNATSLATFENDDGSINEEMIYDAIEEEDNWQEYAENMRVYGSPT